MLKCQVSELLGNVNTHAIILMSNFAKLDVQMKKSIDKHNKCVYNKYKQA